MAIILSRKDDIVWKLEQMLKTGGAKKIKVHYTAPTDLGVSVVEGTLVRVDSENIVLSKQEGNLIRISVPTICNVVDVSYMTKSAINLSSKFDSSLSKGTEGALDVISNALRVYKDTMTKNLIGEYVLVTPNKNFTQSKIKELNKHEYTKLVDTFIEEGKVEGIVSRVVLANEMSNLPSSISDKQLNLILVIEVYNDEYVNGEPILINTEFCDITKTGRIDWI